MICCRWIVIALVLLASFHAGAADSSDDVKVGRVFMTADERARLDRLRRVPEPQQAIVGVESEVGGEDAPEESAVPIGFIISSQGTPYKWIDGDFRVVGSDQIESKNSTANFQITSHRRSSTESKRDPAVGKSQHDGTSGKTDGDHGTPR